MEDTNNRNDHLPVYNIKVVSRLLGLLPVTLRAWERRYGLPNPHRGDQGYRLYSEHDLRTLRWLKNQIDSGFLIGRAALFRKHADFRRLRPDDDWVAELGSRAHGGPARWRPLPTVVYSTR